MKLEKQVCSLELAKKLKKLGVKQESLWYHKDTSGGDWHEGESLELEGGKIKNQKKPVAKSFFMPAHMVTEHDDDVVSAFTTSELGEMLPKFLHSNGKIVSSLRIEKEPHGNNTGWQVGYFVRDKGWTCCECCDTEANARALMACYLLESNLIKT